MKFFFSKKIELLNALWLGHHPLIEKCALHSTLDTFTFPIVLLQKRQGLGFAACFNGLNLLLVNT